MNADNFEPSQDENLPSLNDVLKAAEEHAAIDADLQASSTLDLGLGTSDSPQNDRAERLDDSQLSTLNHQLPIRPMKGESEKAWIAFSTFLDLAPKGASNADVAKATGTSISTIKYWSSRFRWRQRLHHLNAQGMEARVKATKGEQTKAGIDWAKRAQEQSESEWEIATDLREAIGRSLDELQFAPENITLAQVATAAQATVRIGRQAVDRFAPKTDGPSADATALRAQLLANAKKVYGKVKATNSQS